jgi:hypothetical protein
MRYYLPFVFLLNINPSLSSDSSCSFYWMTDASPFPVFSLFLLTISIRLSFDNSRSFYWMTDYRYVTISLSLSLLIISMSQSSNSSRSFYCMTDLLPAPRLPPQICHLTTVALSTGSRMRIQLHFPLVYRPTQVTPSNTPLISFFLLSSDPSHSFIHPIRLLFVLRRLSLLPSLKPTNSLFNFARTLGGLALHHLRIPIYSQLHTQPI